MDERAVAPGEGTPSPTVGRVVYYFTKDSVKQSNGQGEGPYLAFVSQTWGGLTVNLKVVPPFAELRDEGSVSHKAIEPEAKPHWWLWPWEHSAAQAAAHDPA